MTKIPIWHRWQWGVWLVTGLPFQWFMTAFNGLSFFSLPDPPGPNGSPLALWIGAVIFLYHPFFLAPLALWLAWKKSKIRQ